jgi:hypothetical protein
MASSEYVRPPFYEEASSGGGNNCLTHLVAIL